jgi:chromosome segregation ATPase
VRAELDATLRGAQEAASALTSAEKDLGRVREMTRSSIRACSASRALGRAEMSTNLQAVRASHEATLERQNAADGRRREARDEERRYRSLDGNARESSRLAERALRRVLQAEEDAARQQRQEDDVFGQASGEARNLGKRVQAFNGELPVVEVHIAELADAQNQLQEHLRLLDREPDDRLPLDRQLADVAEERIAALNDAKRAIGELSKRLTGCERELATATGSVNAALVELGRLQSQSLPVLLSELPICARASTPRATGRTTLAAATWRAWRGCPTRAPPSSSRSWCPSCSSTRCSSARRWTACRRLSRASPTTSSSAATPSAA